MKIKEIFDRRLVLMVAAPLARSVLSVVTGYLTATGVPAEVVGQLGEALGVVSVIGFNICWDILAKKRAELRGAQHVYGIIKTTMVVA